MKSEGKKKAQLLVKMDPELHKLFKIKTTEQGKSMTAVVLCLINEYLSKRNDIFKDS